MKRCNNNVVAFLHERHIDKLPKRVYYQKHREAKGKSDRMDLGENLKKARKAAGMTQKELAEQLNVYAKDICRWESGERTPSAITLGKICKALNDSADSILELK